MSVQNTRSRLESIEEQLTNLSALKPPSCRILQKITYYVTGHSFAYNGLTPRMRIMGISAINTHSEPINKPLVDEIMDFLDIIYQDNNYVKNLHATAITRIKI